MFIRRILVVAALALMAASCASNEGADSAAEPVTDEAQETESEQDDSAEDDTAAEEASPSEALPEPVAFEDIPRDENGFAAPTGTALNSSTTPDELVEILREITGPTDNFAGDASRLYPFPPFSTPAGATIFDPNIHLVPVYQGFELTVTIRMSAPDLGAREGVEVFLAESGELGWDVTDVDLDAEVVEVESDAEPEADFEVDPDFAFEYVGTEYDAEELEDGTTFVRVRVKTSFFYEDVAVVQELFDGLEAASTADGEIFRAAASHDDAGSGVSLTQLVDPILTANGDFLGSNDPAAQADLQQRAEALGWTLEGDIADATFRTPGNSTSALVSVGMQSDPNATFDLSLIHI